MRLCRSGFLVCALACSAEPLDPVPPSGGGGSAGEASIGGADATGGGTGAPFPSRMESPFGPACGDGVVEGDEGCDDGNTTGGDGCNGACSAFEVCGDGIAHLSLGEDCDGLQDGACPSACTDACLCPDPPGAWGFEEVAEDAGLTAVHGWIPGGLDIFTYQLLAVSGGVAASDYDLDGDVDLFVVGCETGTSALYRNEGNGTFSDVTAESGILQPGGCDAGPVFADFDGDGRDDLFVGGVAGQTSRLHLQTSPGSFLDASAATGIAIIPGNVFSAALADTDLDGDLDLAMGRWGTAGPVVDHFYRNDGGSFSPASEEVGLASLDKMSFTPSFVDMNGDGFLDLVLASDFHTSRMFFGSADGTFTDATTDVIDDDNGMGLAIGDYDGDGDFDWFVSSISDPDGVPRTGWGVTGNRLYENAGDGQLVDATDAAGVREGLWGWGACFADFDNDGDLDLFHTNGFTWSLAWEFHEDPSRLFISNGDGTFTERAAELGLVDTGQGRGIVCFDYDRDGHVDILVQQNGGPMRLYRNNGKRGGHWLDVELRAPAPNARAIGARVEIDAGGQTRVGLIRAGSNYASQDPAEIHFGLGDVAQVDEMRVIQPGGSTSTFGPFTADQRIVIDVTVP